MKKFTNTHATIEEVIHTLEQLHNICLTNERDRILNLIHNMLEEFPFLSTLDTSTLTYVDVLKIIAEHCKNINYINSYADYDEFEIVLTPQEPNPKFLDLFFILFLIFKTKNSAVAFSLGLGNIKRHKPNENQALQVLSDNSVSILDTPNNKLQFICSIQTSLADIILNNHWELKNIDNFLFSKQSENVSVFKYFENRQTGVNLNKYEEQHLVITDIADRLPVNRDVYLMKRDNKIRLLRR